MNKILHNVQAVNFSDIPESCMEYLEENEILETKMYSVADDGNVFSEWLKTLGFVFDHKTWGWVGIWN